MCVCVCTRRPEIDSGCLSPSHLPHILRQSEPLELDLNQTLSASLVILLALESPSIYLGHAGFMCLHDFYMGPGDPNSGPHTCPTSTLPAS